MTQENYSKIIYYALAGTALITAGIIIGHKLYKNSIEDFLKVHYSNLEKGAEWKAQQNVLEQDMVEVLENV